jgi:hypothetical protein
VTGGISADDIKSARWTTQEWLHFLRRLPERLDREEMQKLDEVCQLTNSANAEVACQWLILTIRNSYEQSYCRLEEFITSIGRIKFLKPLYQELVKTTEGKRRALSIFGRARAAYHPIAIAAIEQVLGLRTENP